MLLRSSGSSPGPLFEDALEGLLRELPADTHAPLRRLWQQGLAGSTDLRSEIETYVQSLGPLSQQHEFLDLETARRVAKILLALIDSAPATPSPNHARLVQVAVLYFLEDDDGEGDLDSPIGFDDDEAVAIAVARAVGRGDLAG